MEGPLHLHGSHGFTAYTGPPKGYGEPGLTRRGMVGKLTQITPASWITNVRLGGKERDGSSGQGSGGGESSRLNSISRPPSVFGDDSEEREVKPEVGEEAEDTTQSLQEEYVTAFLLLLFTRVHPFIRITSVLNKLASYKVRLEKVGYDTLSVSTYIIQSHFV